MRAFINQTADKGEEFRELPTRLDTVHLFPHAERGVLVFRAVTRVAEDDGADVRQLMVACETPAAPRPVEHYRRVLAERLDRDKGYLAALRDSDLMPPPEPGASASASAETLGVPPAPEKRLEKNLRRGAELELEKTRELIRQQGLDPDKFVPAALPPEPATPKLEEIGASVQTAMDSAEQHTADAEKKRAGSRADGSGVLAAEWAGLREDCGRAEGQAGRASQFSADAGACAPPGGCHPGSGCLGVRCPSWSSSFRIPPSCRSCATRRRPSC